MFKKILQFLFARWLFKKVANTPTAPVVRTRPY